MSNRAHYFTPHDYDDDGDDSGGEDCVHGAADDDGDDDDGDDSGDDVDVDDDSGEDDCDDDYGDRINVCVGGIKGNVIWVVVVNDGDDDDDDDGCLLSNTGDNTMKWWRLKWCNTDNNDTNTHKYSGLFNIWNTQCNNERHLYMNDERQQEKVMSYIRLHQVLLCVLYT